MKALRLRTRRGYRVRWTNTRRREPRGEAQQMEYIAFDAHKHYTLASVVRPDGQLVREERIEHDRGSLREFLDRRERGSPVGGEKDGDWCLVVDGSSGPGLVPKDGECGRARALT